MQGFSYFMLAVPMQQCRVLPSEAQRQQRGGKAKEML